MRFPTLFAGIFLTFAFAWVGQTMIPNAQLGHLQPQTEEDGSDIYPVNNSGIAARGRQVYISEGCIYCHTQQVRPEQAGSDIDRGWGKRRTVARDYVYDDPVVLGAMRNGPDLANEGTRQIDDKPLDAAWHYVHLYKPQIKVEASNMPSYSYLFEKRKISGERSEDALELDAANSPGAGYEIVPSDDAKALVAYLMSLDRSHALKEVKQEAPAK